MSNSGSRWDALRVWATAIVIVLCFATTWGTAHADESVSDRLDPFKGSDTPALRPAEASATPEPDTSNKSKKPKGSTAVAEGSLSLPAGAVAAGPLTVMINEVDLTVTDDPRRASEASLAVQPFPLPTATPRTKGTKSDRAAKPAAREAPQQDPAGAKIAGEPADIATVAALPVASEKPATEAVQSATVDPAILPDPSVADPAGTRAAQAELADEPWSGERTVALLTERALANGSDPYEVLAVARCETGYTFMPWRDNGTLRRGSLGEVGVAQWLPPVERNHWGRTPHWQQYRYHILAGYLEGDPSAIWWDADALAWSMGPAAPAGFRAGWSCWRIRGPWWFM